LAFAEARKYNLSDPGGKGMRSTCAQAEHGRRGHLVGDEVIEHSGSSVLGQSGHGGRSSKRPRLVFYLRCQPGRGHGRGSAGTDDVTNLARYSDDHGVTWSEPAIRPTSPGTWPTPSGGISVPGPGGAIQDRQGG